MLWRAKQRAIGYILYKCNDIILCTICHNNITTVVWSQSDTLELVSRNSPEPRQKKHRTVITC